MITRKEKEVREGGEKEKRRDETNSLDNGSSLGEGEGSYETVVGSESGREA